ncbi:ABC transporter ATP-binding protein, partial [mine drainage metagenome]
MEEFEDVIKKRFNDASFEYRAKAFREFLRSPVRAYKESPTVKDYVEINDGELESMLAEFENMNTQKPEPSDKTQILFVDDRIVTISDELSRKGIKVLDYLTAVSSDYSELKQYLNIYAGSEREEFLINAAWKNGYVIYIPASVRGLTINVESISDASQPNAAKNIIICGEDSSVTVNDVYRTYSNGTSVHGRTTYLY